MNAAFGIDCLKDVPGLQPCTPWHTSPWHRHGLVCHGPLALRGWIHALTAHFVPPSGLAIVLVDEAGFAKAPCVLNTHSRVEKRLIAVRLKYRPAGEVPESTIWNHGWPDRGKQEKPRRSGAFLLQLWLHDAIAALQQGHGPG